MRALTEFFGDDTKTEFIFAACNSFIRRVLYQRLELLHPDVPTKRADDGRIIVLKMDFAAAAEEKLRAQQEAAAKLRDSLGFRLVFEELVAAKKPIVGHNCMFDLLFLM